MFSLTPWRERREVDNLRREMDRLFDRFFDLKPMSFSGEEAHFIPTVDVSETENDVLVKAEVPGMEAKDIDVSVQGRMLSIRGERKHEKEDKGESYHRVERAYGSFSRTVELPAEVDESKVDASYKRGVLNLKLPKLVKESVKKIAIKAE
ncbi:MAG: Hsp20/alpha crystallin family protein [Desulfatiglandaceae bacterium]